MNLIYYQNTIEKLEEEFQKFLRKWNLRMNTAYMVVASWIGVSVFGIVYGLYFLLFAWIVIIGLIIGFVCVKYVQTNKFILLNVHPLMIKILNEETNSNFSIPNPKDYLTEIKETRFINKYDQVRIANIFKFTLENGYTGYYTYTHAYRSSGQSAYPIITGDIYLLDIENTYDYQIRSDRYSMYKGKKHKYDDYNVFTSKDKEIQKQINEYHFREIVKMYDKKTGIDYQESRISVFNNRKNRLKIKTINKENLENLYNQYLLIIKDIENLVYIFTNDITQ